MSRLRLQRGVTAGELLVEIDSTYEMPKVPTQWSVRMALVAVARTISLLSIAVPVLVLSCEQLVVMLHDKAQSPSTRACCAGIVCDSQPELVLFVHDLNAHRSNRKL